MDDKLALFNPISEKVFKIRGEYVMLDRDLAGLYGIETKVLNQTVKRKIKRFENEDTMFQISQIEYNEILRSQSVTLGWGKYSKFLPYAFTELGVAKLSSVLDSDIAIRVNDQILRYFLHLRRLELNNDDFKKYVVAQLKLHDVKIDIIHSILDVFKTRLVIPVKNTSKYGFKKREDGKENTGLKSKKTH